MQHLLKGFQLQERKDRLGGGRGRDPWGKESTEEIESSLRSDRPRNYSISE